MTVYTAEQKLKKVIATFYLTILGFFSDYKFISCDSIL